MEIASILDPSSILFHEECHSKKRILETIASHLCDQNPSLDPGSVFSALLARERLGSTGIGKGIAIPHCRIPGCDETIGVLVTLSQPIDFGSIDNQPVDIIFVLAVPENHDQDHLETLAALAEIFSQEAIQQKLRSAESTEELYKIITRKSSA